MSQIDDCLTIQIDDEIIHVPPFSTVAAALSFTSNPSCRTSITGKKRLPFCGMGICQECRILVNGRYRPACQTICQNNMIVQRI